MPQKDHQDALTQTILDESSFVRATFKGTAGDADTPWKRVVVRPVLIKGSRHLQFSYFDATRDITKNYQGEEAHSTLAELLAIPFGSVHVETTTGDLDVQLDRTGKSRMHKTMPKEERHAPNLAHDRSKAQALPANKPDPFLQRLGIMNQNGKVSPHMQGKLTQINEFLKLLEHTGRLESIGSTPVNVLDCGSGSAYLSFAAYHYLNDIKGVSASLVGVDLKTDLIELGNSRADMLETKDVCFERSAIIDYSPENPPDIVLALHACDTATDEAIAQGILNGSRIVMVAPCCHHNLNEQIHSVTPFAPVMRDGILKERLADILTDTFRALILRMAGHHTDVVEFVASEHTNRNIMIRAVRRPVPGREKARREYEQLKAFWQVTPYLETLLRDRDKWAILQT